MQQPPQFNWRCVTLNKWCKNKRWLEAWGRGPGDAACFIGQELCTAPGWNGAVHCWDALKPKKEKGKKKKEKKNTHHASKGPVWRIRQRHSFCFTKKSEKKSSYWCSAEGFGRTLWPDWAPTNKGHICILICNFNLCTRTNKSIIVNSQVSSVCLSPPRSSRMSINVLRRRRSAASSLFHLSG